MISDNKPIIYLSHPYGGVPGNICKAMLQLRAVSEIFGTDYTFISPLLNFSSVPYSNDEYDEQLSQCIALLSKCDGMVVPRDTNESLGCLSEIGYAVSNNIPILRLDFKYDHSAQISEYAERHGKHIESFKKLVADHHIK